jgi:hypothetical protein
LGSWSSFVEFGPGTGRQQQCGLANASARASRRFGSALTRDGSDGARGCRASGSRYTAISAYCVHETQSINHQVLHSSPRSLSPLSLLVALFAGRPSRKEGGTCKSAANSRNDLSAKTSNGG